jgi:hypothetical protein
MTDHILTIGMAHALENAPRHSLTAEESADLKMALKHDRVTDGHRLLADLHTSEADEAISEVLAGWDTCSPDSWVAERI